MTATTSTGVRLDAQRHAEDLLQATRVSQRPGGTTRRRFLQGAVVAGLASAYLPAFAKRAAAATPIAATDGVVVVVNCLGGNDLLNTLVPLAGPARGTYEQLRGTLAIAPDATLALDPDHGLHPSLPNLAARWRAGKVAVVQGVGTNGDLSHFSTQATMMAGTAGTSRATGWLGRYGDGLTESDSGYRSVAIGPTVPLHLVGSRVETTALPAFGDLWGADTTTSWERSAEACLRAFAEQSTGLGPWADRVAASQSDAVERAATIGPLYAGGLPPAGVVRDLTLAARLVNADLGTRCITVEQSGFDTHALQAGAHAAVLAALDQGLEAFFGALSPSFGRRVTVLVVSEFGRRPSVNGSLGTDHGRAGIALVIGDNVRGGVYGDAPSLTRFDADGNLVPTVDLRSLYASILGPWLSGDPSGTLGASYPDLGLFAAGPGLRVT